jgi:hypothetical protein
MSTEGLRYSSGVELEVSIGEMVRYLRGELKGKRYENWKKVVKGVMERSQAEREVRVMEAILELVREREEPKLL